MSAFPQTVENTASTPLYVSSVAGGVAPAGVATSAKQDTQATLLTAVRDRLPPALGSQTLAASLSVGIASDSAFGLANKPVAAISTPAPIVGNGSVQQLPSNACTSGCWVSVLAQTADGVAVSTTGARIGESNTSATRGREIAVGDEKWFPVANTNLLRFFGDPTCTIQITVA